MLEVGDIVVAVNGILWSRLVSVRKAVSKLIESDTGPVLLTIWRKGQVFHVLTDGSLDSKWEPVLEPELSELEGLKPTQLPQDNQRMARYELYADNSSMAEIIELRRSFWAMIFPPFWLVFRRMWESLVGLMTVLMTAFVIDPWFGMAVYLAVCVYVGNRQIALLQFAMTRQGKRKTMVLAAASDLEAQNVALRFNEKLQFEFAPRPSDGSDEIDIGLI